MLQVSGREVFEFRPELVDDDDEEADDTRYANDSEDEEDDDEIEKRELEENERRAKHSIDGILGDRCK